MIYSIPTFKDSRGSLSVVESLYGVVPFEVKRVYWIYDVPQNTMRGGHANFTSHQFVIAIQGRIKITLENKDGIETYVLDSPEKGIHIAPMTWNTLVYESPNAVLLVLSSQLYDPKTYINNHDDFLNLCKR